MTEASSDQPRVVVVYFSYSGQTGGLVHRLVSGLKEEGVAVHVERLQPLTPLRFPVGSLAGTLLLMLTTFLRFRVAIAPVDAACRPPADLIVLAGPTWSYNPSGPVLAFLDRDGHLLAGQRVLPLISCRGYWRLHWYGLRHLLRRLGAVVEAPLVFDHPQPEPWRTIGVFLKIAGLAPERGRFIGRYYHRFGHAREQLDYAWRQGRLLGARLRGGPTRD
ncbi:MAG: hypothetical protein AB1413_10905 [Thermodesulfobacteriota bacterium]